MDTNSHPFEIWQSWGVGSSRHTSCSVVMSEEHQFDVPIGPSIVRWNSSTQKRLLQFQAHPTLITCMRLSPDKRHIVTTCSSGEMKLWTNEGWRCEDVTLAPMAQQHHLAWKPDSKGFVIVGNGFGSSVAAYIVTSAKSDHLIMELLWQVKAVNVTGQRTGLEIGESDAESSPGVSNVLSSSQANSTASSNYHLSNAFTMAEVNPSLNILAVQEDKDGNVSVHLLSAEGKPLNSVDTGERSAMLLSSCNSKLNVYGLVVQGGYVLIFDADSLNVKSKFKVENVSRSCVWDGDNLVLPSESGKLVWWSVSGDRIFEANEESHDFIVHLQWSVSGSGLWMCGFSTLSYVEVKRTSNGSVKNVSISSSIKGYKLSCCGVAFSDEGEWLCAGDLAGAVWAMQGTKMEPAYKCSVAESVRCLQWWGELCVLIGCLDGKVYEWRLGKEVKEVCHLKGSVIIMRWSHNGQFLAMGLSTGALTVYSVETSDAHLALIHTFIAHPPHHSNKDMRFGQLDKQAEIWSLCWSPNDNQIATCSEDQTTKIWNTENWTCQATLRGHTMAVTSVDWREDGQGGQSFLATCSDDRTIQIIDGVTFQVIHILSTKDLYGWHTLTYLTLHHVTPATESCGTLKLTCTTQNGYVVVWDVGKGARMACGQIHLGSVEGLAWNKTTGTLATVGSDCVVHLFQLNLACCS